MALGRLARRSKGFFMYRLFRGAAGKKLFKYLLIFFLGIVSLGMVLTLAPIPGGTSDTSQTNVLATLNGTNITVQNLQSIINKQLQNAGNDPKAITRMVQTSLDDIILRQAMLTQASKMGLEVSNQELAAALHDIPYLYQNGQFIGMAAYESMVQQETGMGVPQFENQLRDTILIQKLRDTVTDAVQVTPEEVHYEFLRRNEKARIQYVVFDPTQLVNSVKVTPQALTAYFAAHRANYKVSEQRKVKYVLISPDAVRAQVTVTPDAVEQYYNQHQSDYRVPERVKVAHILFSTTGQTPAQAAATLAKAKSVLAQVKAGANFADLATKDSSDSGSAKNGGELGWIQRGQTVKAFEDAAFSMKPGQISDLIKTQYGYHIIKVEAHQDAQLQPLAAVKDKIQATLEKQQLDAAQQALANKIEQALIANPNEFDTIAKQNGLQTGETPLFTYGQPVPDLGNNEAFENLAFQTALNGVGQPITVPKGVAIIQVTQIVPEHLPNLEEVRDLVEQDYRTEQSKLLAAQDARQFAAQIRTGDFAKLAQTYGLKAQQSQDFTEQDQLAEMIPGTALPSAFTLKPGQTSSPAAVGTTYVV
ncbi:MAG: peptidylprolyl isomerase, partial [Terriglobia bacterium]